MSDETIITNDQKLEWFKKEFRPHFMNWIFGSINRLVVSDDALVGFIFMSCVIDYLSGFWYGADTKGVVKAAYTGFIDTYFPNGKYNSQDLYNSLRNGLVHMFTIKNGKYALTHNYSARHLKLTREGYIYLNASSFRDDLLQATNKYFDEVEIDPVLFGKFLERLDREGFLFSAHLSPIW